MVDSKVIEENMVASLVWLDVQKNDDPSYTSYSWLKPVVESHIAVVSLDEEELFFFLQNQFELHLGVAGRRNWPLCFCIFLGGWSVILLNVTKSDNVTQLNV